MMGWAEVTWAARKNKGIAGKGGEILMTRAESSGQKSSGGGW